MMKYSTLANELYPYLLPKLAKAVDRGNGNGGSGGSGATLLSQLGDVQITSLADNDFLSYDVTTGKWINVDAPAGGGGSGTYTAGWGINIDVSDVISVDVLEITDLNSGLEVVSNKIAVNLQTSSGLVANASGLALDSNLAGDGLDMTAAKIMSVLPNADGGLDVDATGVSILLYTPYSGLITSGGGLRIRDDIAGNGLTITDKILAVGAGNGITVSTNTVAVNQGFNFSWSGTHAHSDLSTFNGGATFNAGTFRFNTDPQVNANLHFLGTGRSITSASHLTLNPTGDLTIDPTGLILLPNAQELKTSTFNDLVAGIAGLRHWDTGGNVRQLTIGKLKADELHVRVFSADEQRVSRGAQFWAYSFGIVETTFTLPADEANVDVWFEEAPDLGSLKLFVPGDWILFRTVDADTGLSVQKVWFQVFDTGVDDWVTREDASDGPPAHVSRQQWRLKRESGGTTGMEIKKGSVGVDFGKPFSVTNPIPGQGVVHLSALHEDGGPFIQIQTFETIASDIPVFKNRVRMGNLSGTVDYSTDIYGFAAGNDLSVVPSAGFSGLAADATNGLRLFNTDVVIYKSGIKTVSLDRNQGLVLKHDVDTLSNVDRQINWYDDIDVTTSVPRTVIGSYVYDNAGMPTRQMELFITGVSGTASAQIVAIRANDPNASRNVNLLLRTRELLSTGAIGSTLELFANEVQIQSKLLVGGEVDETDSIAHLHVVESTTAINQTAGFVIEQKSTGDAVMHWRLTTPNRYYSMGIDNNDGDKFKISASASLGTSDFFVYDPATGLVTVSGLTGGGGGGGGTYTAGSGITIVGTEIAVDSTVVRTSYALTAGDGLIGGGDFSANRTLSVGAGAGIVVNPDSVAINLVANSGLSTVGGLGIASTLAGDGLVLTSGVLDVVALSTGGLQVNTNNIQIKIPASAGLVTDSTGLHLDRRGGTGSTSGLSIHSVDGLYLADSVAGAGLEWSSTTDRFLQISLGAGLEFNDATADALLRIKLPANSGLVRDATGIYVDDALAGAGMTMSAAKVLNVIALSTGGLQVNADSIEIKLRATGSGLYTDSAGLAIQRRGLAALDSGIALTLVDGIYLADTVAGDGLEWTTATERIMQLSLGQGLEFTGTTPARDVRVKLPTNSGLIRDATGIYLDPALAGLGLVMNASGQLDIQPLSTGGLAVSMNEIHIFLRATGSGLYTDANGLAIRRRGLNSLESGISLSLADGIYLADTVAGAGLEWTTTAERILQLHLGGGLEFSTAADPDSTVRIKLPAGSGLLRDATGLYVNPTIAGDGLMMTASGILDVVPTNASITVGANGINVNLGYDYAWSGTHSHSDLSTFNGGATFNAGTFRFNTNPQVNANLDFLGARTITSNATNALTIAAGGNLILASAGDLARSTSFSDLVTGISGFRMWDRGANYIQLTMGAIKIDELYARVFVADEVRINRGEEYWSKSFGVVETDFVLPADEGTVNVWFENSPGLAAANLFSVGDWLLLRAIDWGTGLAIYKVWFTVTALVTGGGVDGYRQRWTIKREIGGVTGLTVKKGGVMLDAGQIGQGWIHLSALAQDGGPFIQIGDFTSIVASDTPTFTNRVRMGNLSGAAGITGTFWGFAAGNDLSLDASLGSFSGFTVGKGIGSPGTNYDGLRIYNTDIRVNNAGIQELLIPFDGGIRILQGGATFSERNAVGWYSDVNDVNTAFAVIYSQTNVSGDHSLILRNNYTVSGETGVYLRSIGPSGQVNIDLLSNPTETYAHFSAPNFIRFVAPSVAVGNISPVSALHVYENTSSIGATTGVTIEQDGSGDALLQLLLTDGQRWVIGIDNSITGDPLRIAASTDLTSAPLLNLSTAGILSVTGSAAIGAMITPSSRLHVYENNALTDATVGVTIEQDGSGDAALNFYLTGGQYWVMGIDNSITGDPFRISPTADLANQVFALSTTGALTLADTIRTEVRFFGPAIRALTSAGLRIEDDGGNLGMFVEDATGHVGFGHAAPVVPIHVIGSGVGGGDANQTIIRAENTAAAGAPALHAKNDQGVRIQFVMFGSTFTGTNFGINRAGAAMFTANPSTGPLVIGTETAKDLVFGTNDTRRMSITSDGLIGIGEPSPVAQLDMVALSTADPVLRMTTPNSTDIVMRRHSGTAGSPTQVGAGVHLMQFGAQGYTSSGWPTAGFFSGWIQISTTEAHTTSARGTQMTFRTTANGESSNTIALIMEHDGQLTAGPTYSNTVSVVPNMSIASGGRISRTTHVNSSLRYKEDVQTIDPDTYEGLFDSLRPISYRLKPDYGGNVPGARRKVGLIAEEVEAAGGAVFVQYDTEGKPDVLMYDRLIVVLIAEIQKLKRRMTNWEGGI